MDEQLRTLDQIRATAAAEPDLIAALQGLRRDLRAIHERAVARLAVAQHQRVALFHDFRVFARHLTAGQTQLVGLSSTDRKRQRIDRHAPIGEGEIGTEAFGLLLSDVRLAGVPVILETPSAGLASDLALLAARLA